MHPARRARPQQDRCSWPLAGALFLCYLVHVCNVLEQLRLALGDGDIAVLRVVQGDVLFYQAQSLVVELVFAVEVRYVCVFGEHVVPSVYRDDVRWAQHHPDVVDLLTLAEEHIEDAPVPCLRKYGGEMYT